MDSIKKAGWCLLKLHHYTQEFEEIRKTVEDEKAELEMYLSAKKEKLQEEDFEISWTTLDGQNPEKATDIQFNQKSTNLSS